MNSMNSVQELEQQQVNAPDMPEEVKQHAGSGMTHSTGKSNVTPNVAKHKNVIST